jgi:hypothetical protein
MRKFFTLLFIAGLAISAKAQMLTPTVISSTGAYSSNANGSLSYTVGEMTMVETFSAGGNILTQGFQQPTDKAVGLINITKDAYGSFVLYPNPAVDQMFFGFEFPNKGKVSVSMYDAIGQKIADLYESNYDNGKVVQNMDVSTYAAGMYFLTVTHTDDNGNVNITTKKFNVIN